MKFLQDDANASSSIIDSLIEFSQKQYNDDSIYGMIPTMQFINEVNKLSVLYPLIYQGNFRHF
jgi:hypothetical protein